jgi:hypothetical protein
MLSLIFALLAQVADVGVQPAREVRRHFVATTQKGATLYEVTVITRTKPDEDQHVVLIEDAEGNDYQLTHIRSYLKQETEYELRDVRRKTWVKTIYAYPFKSRTRDETIAEAKASPRLDIPLTVETPAAARTAKESEWKEVDNARQWTGEIRESLDPVFVEAIERMRGGLFVGEAIMENFCHIVVRYVLHANDCSNAGNMDLRPAQPDCLFDASMGFACSEKQKQRVSDAVDSGKELTHY